MVHICNFKYTFCTCKVFNTLHLNTWGSIYTTSKKYFLHVQSIKYFAPNYLGVHISNFKKVLLARAKYSILCTCKKYIFEVGYIEPQVFRCKVLNTLHVQEVLFSKLDVWTPRYMGAKYWILCTCKKYFFKVGYMDPQVFRCKVLNTLHVQEVFLWSGIYGPPGI